jgi:hypothetical protein
VPRVNYTIDYRPKNSFSMSYASRKVIFPGVEALRQVGWIRQSLSFHRLRAPYRPKLLQIQSFLSAQSFRWRMSLYGSLKPSSLKQGSLKHIMIDCVSIEGTYTHICKRALCMHPHWHACMHPRLVITSWIPSAQLYTFSVAAE